MKTLMIRGGLLSFSLLWLFALPLMLEIDFILDIWLDEVPEYTSTYVILALIFSLVQTMYSSVNIGIHATGKIKMLSFIGGSLLMSGVFISYLMMRLQGNLLIPFMVNILIVGVSAIVNLYILRHEMSEFDVRSYIKDVYLKSILIILITLPLPLALHLILGRGVVSSLFVIFVSVLCVSAVLYFMILSVSERKSLNETVRNMLRRNA